MKLSAYLSEYGAMSKLAKEIGSHTQSVWHWSTGARPVPVSRCLDIERATGGQVTRRDLRPNDWQKIWPDFGGKVKRTALVPAKATKPATETQAQGV